MTLTLATLLEKCRSGDELAWEALVRRYQARVYGLAFHYLGHVEDARDVAQDVFVKIYRRLDSCTDPDRFLPWVIRITRNACIDRLRRMKVRPSGVPIDEIGDLPGSDPAPDELWTHDRRKRLLHRALQSMSVLNREVIVLRAMQEMSFEEIAGLLDVPVGTVKSRANRARLELAKRVLALEAGGPVEGGG